MTCSERGNFHHVFVRVFIHECLVCICIPVLSDFYNVLYTVSFTIFLLELTVGAFFILNKSGGEGKAKIRNYKYFLHLTRS